MLAELVVFMCGPAMFTYSHLRKIYVWLGSLSASVKSDVVDWGAWLSFKHAVWSSLDVSMRGFALKVRSDDILREHGPYIAAWNILTYAWPLAATDPRDKAYSLLGLINIGIEADYSKSPEMVYHEVATIMFNQVPRDE